MQINPYLFILPRTPGQIVWNYKDHTQHELDLDYSSRLAQLIHNPELYDNDNIIDTQLLNAGILTVSAINNPVWGWDELSKIYHIGTRNIPCEYIPDNIHEWARQYLEHCNEVLASSPPADDTAERPPGRRIALPAPSTLNDDSLSNALTRRKTCRSFTGSSIALKDVGTLLYLTLGYLREREGDDSVAEGLDARRSSPSGGGLNACEGYLLIQNVEGLAPGVYAYHPTEHALSLINPSPDTALGNLLGGQHFINNLPLGLFITARFDRLWWKYPHSRAYRMAFVEAGHLSQTFQLAATALGMNTWLTGAFADDQVDTLLQLENATEQPLFFVGCGESDGQAMCQEMRDLLRESQA
ncbi:dehydrogenase [Pseudomonas sp. FW215-R2]|uniref:SagB family peptide dehydrogenase n=1 Tax=unclassified Pseudomonas TaxID=196821 RepID=UPI000C886FD7|nr:MULTISPECIES: SagB family peptide dehydrogenase [unclassified Pseudomonas]PMX04063.1 dehydrogenase [Pseudomonas sp. FW215-R2]PMX12329.1 dehydrogenase [Pseudomonas sp. FW215-L1]PMX26389.1 dehydrogenase [Pseudomonas sp. FW215-E1]PNA33120.1 dehydrogenase [Pseudomonas sp. FW215-R4]